jgi:hypothetical protein
MIMTSRKLVLWALGLALLPGCGHSYQPTIRQVSYHPDDARIAAAGPTPPEEDAVCPGGGESHRLSGQGAPGTDPKVQAEKRANLVKAANARVVDPNVLKPTHASAPKPDNLTPAISAGLDERQVRLGAKSLVAPQTWARGKSPIPVTLAAFSLPRAPGDDADAELSVTPLAQDDAQSLKNLREELDREPGGKVEHLRIGDAEVVLVDSSVEPSEANEARYRVLNATVFVGERAYSVMCSGPEKTVGEHAGAFRGFLQTMK